jgi:hypothetical protein
VNGLTVREQNSLLRVQHVLPKLVEDTFIFNRFGHVKNLSKESPTEFKTYRSHQVEDGFEKKFLPGVMGGL